MTWRTYPALAATALAALVPLTLPAPASAATSQVAVTGGRLEVAALTSGPHRIKVVRLSVALQTFFEVTDSAGTLVPGGGCAAVTSAKVRCPVTGITSYQVASGDDGDTIDVRTLALPGVIDGGAGDDTLYPGTGGEVIIGGDGRDRVSYIGRPRAVGVRIDDVANDGSGREGDNVRLDVEWVTGGSGADVLVGDADANRLDGGPGDDVLDGAAGADTMIGGDGLDTVTYASRTAPVRVVHGATGNGVRGEGDVLDPTVEIAIGGAGNDTMSGFFTAHGGAGNDTMQGDDDLADQLSQVYGGPGDDVLSDPDNDITPEPSFLGGDRLHGGEGVDHLTGVADLLDGGPGPDVIVGPSVLTYADYSARTAPVTVTLDGVANDGEAGEGDNVTTSAVLGGAGADKITGSGVREWLLGGAGADTVTGGGGNDWMEGGAGGDNVNAGTGDDRVWGDDFDPDSSEGGNDVLTGGPGADDVQGQWGDDLLVNGPGADRYDGGEGQLVGSDATPGSDTLTYAGSTTPVTVTLDDNVTDGAAGEGDVVVGLSFEHVVGGSAADTIVGHDGANRLRGGPGDDTLEGLGGVDLLYGLAGNDQMSGGDDDDFLYGDIGTDAANGGNGTDTCAAELLIFCEL